MDDYVGVPNAQQPVLLKSFTVRQKAARNALGAVVVT